MPVELDDANLLKLCADFWVQREEFHNLNEQMDAEKGNAAGEALDRWNELRDKIQETRPVTTAGLAEKSRVCAFALQEVRGADQESWEPDAAFALALLNDAISLGDSVRAA